MSELERPLATQPNAFISQMRRQGPGRGSYLLRPHGGSVSGLDPGLGAVMLLSGINGRPDLHGVGGGGNKSSYDHAMRGLTRLCAPSIILSLRLCQPSLSVAPFQNNLSSPLGHSGSTQTWELYGRYGPVFEPSWCQTQRGNSQPRP